MEDRRETCPMYVRGAGIAQWLERRTRDWKVAGSNPCRSGGRIFFPRVNFLCWLLFRYPFHPRVTAVARKRPRPFRQKCRWQVTTKHAYTLRMWLCMKWYGADIHQSDCTHCQWFDKSLLTFWNYLIKKYFFKLNALLSLFLTAYHYSLGVFSTAKDTKAGAIEGCQTWMSLTLSVTECMSSLDIYVSLKPEALCILDSYLPFGVAPPGFQPGLAAWKNSLSSIPPTFPFTVCKPWPSARGMVLVALTAEYQECLKVALSMCIINASLHGGIVTVQQGWGVLTHFVDIYHLFTSTEKMHGMFQFHYISLTW